MICDIKKPPLNELTHFGVLGMKWGKRKKQEKSKHRSNLEAKYKTKGLSAKDSEDKAARRIRIEKALIIAASITLTTAAAISARKEYVKNWTDTKLKTGTIFKRMAQSPDGDISTKTFVSFLSEDNAHYEKLRYGGSKMYQVSLKSVNEIVVPSNHTVNKLWKKVVTENSEFIKSDENIRQFANTIFSKDPEIARASIGVIPRNNQVWKAFANELKESGFNAVTDYTDAGGGAKKPLILIDAARDVLNIGGRLITDD